MQIKKSNLNVAPLNMETCHILSVQMSLSGLKKYLYHEVIGCVSTTRKQNVDALSLELTLSVRSI